MILKTLTYVKGDEPCWNFYDNISSASVYFDVENEMSCVKIIYKDMADPVTIAIANVAYLCNNEGKTIEVLHPRQESKCKK